MNRLYYALIHPSRLGIYLKDKFYIPLIYLICFMLLSVSPLIIKHNNSRYYFTPSETNYLVKQVPTNSNGIFENNTFTIDNAFSITDTDNVIYNFDTTNSIAINTKSVVFVFSSSSLIVYQNGTRIINTSYSNFNIDNFNLNDVNSDSKAYYSFQKIFENIYNDYFKSSNVYFISETITDAIFIYLIIILLLYVVTILRNPYLNRSQRFNLAIYSMTYSFIFIFIGNYFNLKIMPYIGTFISTYCLLKSLKNIKVIKLPGDKR